MLTFTLRLDDTTEERLDDLSKLFGCTRSEAVRKCIDSTWIDINQEHPEAKAALEKLQKLADMIKAFNDK